MGCLTFSQHPCQLLIHLPGISQGSYLPRPRRVDLSKQALETGLLVPTQPGPSPALSTGTHLTSMVFFKDTAAVGKGGGSSAGLKTQARPHPDNARVNPSTRPVACTL